MKKVLNMFILLAVLFFPFYVNAKEDVVISNIRMINKTEFVEGFDNPQIDGLTLTVDGKFTQVSDSVTYSFTIKNQSDEDYTFEDWLIGSDTVTPGLSQTRKYISYGLLCDDLEETGYILSPNTTHSCNLTISYTNEVSSSDLVDGKYTDNYNYEFKLLNEEEVAAYLAQDDATNTNTNTQKTVTKNPSTNNNLYFMLGIITIAGVSSVLVYKRNKKFGKILSVAAILLIPASVYAINSIRIVVKGQIEIEPTNYFCYYDYYNDFDGLNATYHKYDEGMTWREYLTSNLNEDFVGYSVLDYNITETLPLNGNRHVNAIGAPMHGKCTDNCGSYVPGYISSLDDKIMSASSVPSVCYTYMDVGTLG